MPQVEKELTAEEAAIYDRQMRLWGVEAQKRLQSSHILISGLTQLGSELAKNLVLSGMNVTLHDVHQVTIENVESQFFLREEHIGVNRAEACLEGVQELNPLVKVQASTGPLTDMPLEYFNQFSVVCILSASRKLQIYLDKICRERKIAFYAGHSFGLCGIFFCDLGQEHSYRRNVQAEQNTAEPAPSLSVQYPTLEASTQVKWETLKPTRKRSPATPAAYIAYQLLLDYLEKHDAFPSVASTSTFIPFAKSKLNDQGLADFFNDEQLQILATTAQADIVPVCAIVAGILGQEVVKAISLKDEPIANYFFFDGTTGEGTVRRI